MGCNPDKATKNEPRYCFFRALVSWYLCNAAVQAPHTDNKNSTARPSSHSELLDTLFNSSSSISEAWSLPLQVAGVRVRLHSSIL